MVSFSDDVAEYDLSEHGDFEKNLKIWRDRFIDDKFASKVSPKTIKSYKNALAPFLTFCEIHKKQMDMKNISARFVNRYFIWYQQELAHAASKKNQANNSLLEKVLKESKKKTFGKNDASFEVFEAFENTLSHRLVVLKDFLKFITENNRNNQDYVKLFENFFRIKIHEKMTDYLTQTEMSSVIKEMLEWPDSFKSANRKPRSSEKYAYRDSLLILIYCLTGARSEEVVHIKLKDIVVNDEYYVIKIEKGKGGKKRSVAASSELLKRHIEYLEDELPNSEYYLSSTYDEKQGAYINKPMNADSIRRFSNFILKLLSIKKSGLHATRRGYATKRIAKDGVDISTVAKELGNTTAILEKHYYKHSVEV